MKSSLDCIPCFIRQALDVAKMASKDLTVHKQLVRDVLIWAAEINLNEPPPVMGQRIHRKLREITGVVDPYRAAKDHQNRMALGLLAEMKAEIKMVPDPLTMALRLAIAGNVIDMGVNGNLKESDLRHSIRQSLVTPFVGEDDSRFRQSIHKARRIVYLADNAGEIVFDRVLIELLSPERVTLVVRGAPVINDVTMADAQAVGLSEIVEVIDNGSDAPGTIITDCNSETQRRIGEADLILAKGQGNYETLSDEPLNIYFLFKVKCPVIETRVGLPVGTHVLVHSCDNLSKSGDS